MRTHLAVLLLAGLGGCAAQPRTALPDASVIAAHEWDHGPPWGPEEIPWVAPPPDTYYAGSPWYWGGPAVGLGVGIGIGRGHWWGGHRGGFHRGGGWHGGRGFHRGGGWHGGRGFHRGGGWHGGRGFHRGGGHFGGGRRGGR
ncbi:hypothetical protein JMJ55_08380 [Belnapia sp. T6]|uniref:Lipoprotein n=1 Tax=Belnapia mucosa TaxID=2804532 RepID=A0ABS1V0V3_9PROT|nr:hypothetical protein [Belnapia mucosa]MBL6455334.1 hypothetical protein [Belnapia mucosa]